MFLFIYVIINHTRLCSGGHCMKQDEIVEYARLLVEITIKKHKEKLLGNDKMSNFIKSNLPIKVKKSDYNNILHLYNKYLAKEGYEIKKDINNFNIIDYHSEEYQIYINKLN